MKVRTYFNAGHKIVKKECYIVLILTVSSNFFCCVEQRREKIHQSNMFRTMLSEFSKNDTSYINQ